MEYDEWFTEENSEEIPLIDLDELEEDEVSDYEYVEDEYDYDALPVEENDLDYGYTLERV